MAPREARQTDVWFCCLLVSGLGRAPKCPEPRFPPLALSAEAHRLAAPPLASRADPVPGHGAQTLNLLGWLHAGLGEQGLASPGRSVSPGRVSRAAEPPGREPTISVAFPDSVPKPKHDTEKKATFRGIEATYMQNTCIYTDTCTHIQVRTYHNVFVHSLC